MKKKVDIKKRIKLLSWTSLIGLVVLTTLSAYNAIAYIKNLEQVKIIIELLNKNTSPELKGEVIQAIVKNIENSQIVVFSSAVIGIVLLSLVVYLGVSIKKETNRRIHAMDWIIED
jgi:tetrahydromethanopterin S-methyltransferase subunit G